MELEFEHKFCIFSMKKQGSYFRLNMSQRVTRSTNSNVPMEERKNESLTIRS